MRNLLTSTLIHRNVCKYKHKSDHADAQKSGGRIKKVEAENITGVTAHSRPSQHSHMFWNAPLNNTNKYIK